MSLKQAENKKNAYNIDEKKKPSMFLKSYYTYLTSLTPSTFAPV